ncbi:hypothetical protein ACJRO7_035511 [Eucalyptus globulus]|uniref:Secreted protein n=1 Tax=Eucalyptus globulus TaxID=34317 RepID=A0ABD3J938_EUCGL
MRGLNGLKYFPTILAVIMRTGHDLRRGGRMEDHRSGQELLAERINSQFQNTSIYFGSHGQQMRTSRHATFVVFTQRNSRVNAGSSSTSLFSPPAGVFRGLNSA